MCSHNTADLLKSFIPVLSSGLAPCKVCWGVAFQLIKKGPPRPPEGWVTDSGWEDVAWYQSSAWL